MLWQNCSYYFFPCSLYKIRYIVVIPKMASMFMLLNDCLVSSLSLYILQPFKTSGFCHAYGYYLKLFIWIHVSIAINRLNHCHQLFNYVHNLDINWSISDTACLLVLSSSQQFSLDLLLLVLSSSQQFSLNLLLSTTRNPVSP